MQGNDQSGADNKTAALGIFVFVVDVWATSLQVFLHVGFGWRALGKQAAAVLLLVPIYIMLWQHYDPRPMVLFMPAYLLMCGLARLAMLSDWLKGRKPIHSRYNGRPVFHRLVPFVSEITFKLFVEPAMVFAGAFVVARDNKPLGYFLMIGAVCLSLQTQLTKVWMRIRLADMHDAMIEQEAIAEEFRKTRGDEF
jgi:hypothetical protein